MKSFPKLPEDDHSAMANKGEDGDRVVCVTGAGGYIASWLVKNLLEGGYTVHATLRDPGDKTKCGPLLDLAGAQERLKLFKADLLEEGSFDSAVDGCQGVFHVASPMGANENSLDDFVVTAVNGVLNVLRACTRTKSVRRVVYTSSVAAACPLDEKGGLSSSCLDESCWSPLNFLKSQTNNLAWYMVSKTLAEQEALKYGAHNKLEVVTVLPPVVVGPWLTNTSGSSSSKVILSLIGESDASYQTYKFLHFTMRSIGVVHIDDICNAHIFLMEHSNAQGRHVCCTGSRSFNSLKELVAKQLNISPKLDEEDSVRQYVPVSSKKLLDMGFTFKYSLEEAFKESIDCAIQNGILNL